MHGVFCPFSSVQNYLLEGATRFDSFCLLEIKEINIVIIVMSYLLMISFKFQQPWLRPYFICVVFRRFLTFFGVIQDNDPKDVLAVLKVEKIDKVINFFVCF